MEFNFEYAKWPLIVLTIEGDMDDNGYKKLKRKWYNMYRQSEKKGQRFSLLIDVTKIGNIPFGIMTGIPSFLGSCKELSKKHMNKSALLLAKDSNAKGIFDLVLTLYQPARPLKTFKCPNECSEWLI